VRQKTICVINYGMGNIGSVCNALDYLGGCYITSDRKEALEQADALILPGVGAFGAAMENLARLDLIQALTDHVLDRGKPFLGICLGMQLLAEDSHEQGFHRGLGWIKGHVTVLQPSNGFRVPHVGWNNVRFDHPGPLFNRVDNDSHFFFDHGFHFTCNEEVVLATSDYGEPFVAALHKNNIFATQFHPEKSQRNGLKLLRNFLNVTRRSEPSPKESVSC